jgi:methionyl-tRNA formyltransferase
LSTTLHPAVEGTSFRPVEVTLSDVAAIAHADLDAVDPAAAQAMHDAATQPGCALLSSALSALVVKTKASNPPHHLLVRTLKTAGKKSKRAQEWYAAYHDRAHPTTRMLIFA